MTTGSVLAQFTITLSQAVSEQVAVEWHTADGTALAGVDYAAAKGTVLFAPGETAKTVDILVYGRAVGSEDRSFFVEMLPPVNAILGASIGECIIHVDTTGSTPVTVIIVPTGPQGAEGKSAYQVWLDLGNTGTEQDFIDSLSPSPEEIAEEVAPLLDMGESPVTAAGTEALSRPDTMKLKELARRVAYAGSAKIATVVLADGDNLLSQSDLTGDVVDFRSIGLYPRIMRGPASISPVWSVEQDGRILIKDAVAGDVLYVCQYDTASNNRIPTYGLPIIDTPSFDVVPSHENPATASYFDVQVQALANRSLAMLRRHAEDMAASIGFTLAPGSFEKGTTITSALQVLLQERTGKILSWGGALNKEVPENSTPDSTGGIGSGLWTDRTTDKAYKASGADVAYTQQERARRQLSAADFTPHSTDLGASVNAVRASLETEYSPSATVGIRGGECFLPRGTHISLTPINIERHASGVSSFSIKGQGQLTSQIDMTGAPAFTDGITGGTGGPAFGELSDFGVTNAPRSGTRLGKYSRMTFRNMDMRNSGADGYYFGNGFVAVMEKLTASFNASSGFTFDVALQHTSHVINGGYAFQNSGSGWDFGFMNYCVVTALASDNNPLYGYTVAKSDGFAMNGCGAESNGRSAFAVLSSAVKGATKNTTINNGFAYHNNLAGAGYPNLLYALAADGQAAHVRISKSKSIPNAGDTTKDIIADGVGAEIEIDDCEMPNGWESRNGGYIHWVHKTLLVRGITIPVAPAATPICKLQSTQGHKVRYAGEITVLASNMQPSTGERSIAIYKLLISKSIGGGNQYPEISKAGMTLGGAASHPSFSFSVVSDQLVVTPIGSTGGTQFWFEIDTSSQIVASAL